MIGPREFLSGDRGRFAFKLSFHPDPEAAMPEESLSWGSFELWAGGQNLCEHAEQGEPVAAVYWHMLPLLEWLVGNWNYLLHESRLPLRHTAADAHSALAETAFAPEWYLPPQEQSWHEAWKAWWGRHSILAARAGGLFPNVVIRRWQDLIELAWAPARLAGQPEHYQFLAAGGYRRFGVEEVSQALYDVLEGASAHLRKALPDLPRIAQLHQSVQSLKATPLLGRLAVLSGLEQSTWQKLEQKAQGKLTPERFTELFVGRASELAIVETPAAALMFGSTSPTLSATDVDRLAERLIDVYAGNGQPTRLLKLARQEPLENNDGLPWQQGYALADELLETLGLPDEDQEFVDVEAMCQALGIHLGTIELEDQEIRAVSVAGPHLQAAIFLNQRHATHQWPSGQRFTLAHELCHLLYDRAYAKRLALASGPWAPRDLERRANSFAAELLMPAELIQRLVARLRVPLASREVIVQLCGRLRTSFTATLEHLGNLGLLAEADQERIRNEADDRLLSA